MVYRRVIEWPSKSLKRVSTEYKDTDEQALVDLVDTFRVKGGLGLSAPQVGYSTRLIVVNESLLVSSSDNSELVMKNPVITESSNPAFFEERCFSLPGISIEVERFSDISVRWTDQDGKICEREYSGYPAACIQHEIDHLDGKVTIDRISQLKRSMIIKKIKRAASLEKRLARNEKSARERKTAATRAKNRRKRKSK